MGSKWSCSWPLLLTAMAAPALSQRPPLPILYQVSFDNAVHHEARISVTYRDIERVPLRLQMSRSSPGRYAIHEFAKNVYQVEALDGAGRPLPIRREDPYGWTVTGHDGTVTFSYTLYADRGDGTYSQIDATHAHLNMPATFVWAQGQEARPIEIRFKPFDPSWKIATQLAPGGEPRAFRAPNLQYFLDSPTELSDHEVREWQVADGDRQHVIRLAVHHQGKDAEVDRFAAMARKVVDAQVALFGDAPDFDFGTYTFIADYLPHVAGDGMEHRNSTIISDTRSLAEANYEQLQTLSHEFFHAWNVERLRPAELEPFDFTRANPTPSLWFAEGFTNYYGPLLIRRAGEMSTEAYVQALSESLNRILNAPGRRYGSPQEMSLRAAFVDAATSIDPVNPNIFVSYYPYGAVIALGLDLSIRQRFPGKSLDQVMRRLWDVHGRSERPYRPDDLQSAVAEVTGDPAFANGFFDLAVRGSGLPEFGPLLAQMGLKLQLKDPGRSWSGASAVKVNAKMVSLDEAPAPGSPLYQAGLEQGDRIVSIGGARIESEADWTAALQRHRPGASAPISFVQRGRERQARIQFVADPSLEIVMFEKAGLSLTPAQRAARASWIGREQP